MIGRVAPLLLGSLACAACAGRLRGEIDAVGGVIEGARAAGAERCAPRELAMAVAHREFAGVELDEGDYRRARAELAVAAENASAAARRSPRERCRADLVDRDRDGVPDVRDRCPARAEDRDRVQDGDGCPDDDNDADGLVDATDKCPDEPEDRDGFADQDGCGDPDNDGDGRPDLADRCPEQAEDVDQFADHDGCPDCDDDGDQVPECPQPLDRCPGQPGQPPDGCRFRDLVVTDTRIEIRRPVQFAPGRASIAPASHGLLAEVARALAENRAIHIRVEGHTDSQGRSRTNLRLSRARAAAVRRFLIARGIDKARILSEGYGEERPVAENRTPQGRAQNRRVEFVITGR